MYQLCRLLYALRVWTAVVCAFFILPGAVVGAAVKSQTYPLSEVVFRIEARNEFGRAFYEVEFEEGEWDPNEQVYSWSVSGVDLVDPSNNEWIGALTDASLFVRAAQMGEIELNIGFISGPAETDVRAMSPLVKFTDHVPPSYSRGRAVASITLTDGGGDGAYMYGAEPLGTGIFRAYYNGYLERGVRLSHLVSYLATDGGGSVTASQFDPIVGFKAIGVEVVDISSDIEFTLSPMDLAYAFTTVDYPEPPVCPGDLNDDGAIGLHDLAAFLSYYGSCYGDDMYEPDADLDDSGCVDISDLSMLLVYYGGQCW